MNANGMRILAELQAVEAERARRRDDPQLAEKVHAVKSFQQERFRRGYADLLDHPRQGPAARFFLEELYGPEDFTDRDAQFARIVPALVRLFPEDIVDTVATLAELHALSEHLDTCMGVHLSSPALTAADYVRAWQLTGEPGSRARQIGLTLQVGRSLDRITRNAVLRHTLRLMRGPARAAGMSALQEFLERGFETFRGMRGAEPFLQEVQRREEALCARLFEPDAVAMATDRSASQVTSGDPLVQLP
jgi:hypothetical protein